MEVIKRVKIIKHARAFLGMLFFVYLSYLFYLTFLSSVYGRTHKQRSINCIPFKTIFFYLNTSNDINVILTNILGNIIAFIPMGFLLPIIFKRFRKFRNTLIAVFGATLAIEVIQYITAVGASDVDDILLNLIGGIAGYILYRLLSKLLTIIGRNKLMKKMKL